MQALKSRLEYLHSKIGFREAVTEGKSSDRPQQQLLPWKTRAGYGLGHILNDLFASIWFTYLILFFSKVLRFGSYHSGMLLLVGQVADGLFTPLVGYLSDKGGNVWPCSRYGKRKTWHLLGTVCVVLSFPFIFNHCIGCSSDEYVHKKLLYYSGFIVVFTFGWAATQISHLAMIPDLTTCQHERTGLTATRYGCTVAYNIAVYLVAWLLLLGVEGQGGDDVIGPKNAPQFMHLVLFCISVGFAASIMFHIVIRLKRKEESGPNAEKGNAVTSQVGAGLVQSGTSPTSPKMRTATWFLEPQFYLVGGVYMFTRLFVILSQIYIPLYLQDTLHLGSTSVATVPLAMFLAGLITSFFIKFVNKKVGRKWSFLLGCAKALAGCLWIRLGCSIDGTTAVYEIYGVATLIGSGGCTMQITGESLIAHLIAEDTESGAFMYGAMSLLDKLSTGGASMLIQSLIPGEEGIAAHRAYYQYVVSYGCGGAAVFGAAFVAALQPFNIGERWKVHQEKKRTMANAQDSIS